MRRILVVEDDPIVRTYLQRILQRHGWSVSLCSCGADALVALATFDFDVVLADLELGSEPSGLEVLKLRPARNRQARFVVMTGYGTQQRCREAFLNGAADFVDKPFNMGILAAALEPTSTQPETTETPASDLFPKLAVGVLHVQAAIRELERRYKDRALTVEGIATTVGISPEHLTRLFKQHLGRSPLEHLHDARIAHAKRLLLQSSLSVYVIARECGYHTTSELDRHFHFRCDSTPSAFRLGTKLGLSRRLSSIANECQDSTTDLA